MEWPPPALPGVLVATGCTFALSVVLDNSSAYDPYWSLQPPALLLWWWWCGGAGSVRALLALAIVTLWGARLTYSCVVQWQGHWRPVTEDWRYAEWRARGPLLYWAVSAFGFHAMPSLLTYAAALPLHTMATLPTPLHGADALWIALALGAGGFGGRCLRKCACSACGSGTGGARGRRAARPPCGARSRDRAAQWAVALVAPPQLRGRGGVVVGPGAGWRVWCVRGGVVCKDLTVLGCSAVAAHCT